MIVLVKAGDTAAAAVTAARMHPLGVLSLQNGLTMDLLRAHCDAPQVEQGITTEGAYRDEAGVHPSGAGETLVPPGFEPPSCRLALLRSPPADTSTNVPPAPAPAGAECEGGDHFRRTEAVWLSVVLAR